LVNGRFGLPLFSTAASECRRLDFSLLPRLTRHRKKAEMRHIWRIADMDRRASRREKNFAVCGTNAADSRYRATPGICPLADAGTPPVDVS
jgi:hypothetical protein